MTNPAPDVLRLVPEKLDNTWVLEQAKSLSSDKSEDAVKALAWNLVVHHRRMIEKCPVAPAVQPAAGREEIALHLKLLDTLKPFAEVAEKLKHCHVVEICEPTPDNPSRNIIPMPREWFERAADDLEAIAIQLHADGTLSEGQAAKITGLDRVEVRKQTDAILAAISTPAQASGEPVAWPVSVQRRVDAWMQECFGAEISADKVERSDRFVEEALELVQSVGYDAVRAHALVDYVFGRDAGEPAQEVGGVMVTLAALCNTFGLDIQTAADTEIDRITQPEIVLKIRAKHAAKPTGSALPIAHPPAQASETGGEATGAEAVVRDGQIVISVAVDALPLILSGSIATNAVAGTFKVTDAETFAKEVCSSLNAEKEDGTTRVHMMFDSAFNHAIEQGAEGVEDISEDEFEMEAARLAEAALSAPQAAPGEGEQS